jgi:predicted GNAT superfamily acetyltransferase
MMAPRQLRSTDTAEIADVLTLIRAEFAYMIGRIDPPSSMYRLTGESIATLTDTGEVWVIGDPIEASVFFTWQPDALYIGKLAVAAQARGSGHARTFVELAQTRARACSLPRLRLESRIELAEVHAAFSRLGFAKTGETAHQGYNRPTSITMERDV